jgi:acyl-CoA reductase-like NAD-dependent aldehyde dehydrogenase
MVAHAAKGKWKTTSGGELLSVATVKNFVGGRPVDARVREEIDVPYPATGQLLGRVPVSEPEDVDRAVRAAREAYQEWSLEPVTRRARRMFRLQVLLEDHIYELAEIATRENGKHVEESAAASSSTQSRRWLSSGGRALQAKKKAGMARAVGNVPSLCSRR